MFLIIHLIFDFLKTYNRTSLSFPPEATLEPLGAQSTANTSSPCPGNSISSFLFFMFHTIMKTNLH